MTKQSRVQHVAIVHRRYLDAILEGRKRVEARLTRARKAPFGVVAPGHRVYLKQAGGPIRGVALVRRVVCVEGLTPEGVRRLRERFEPEVGAGGAFWEGKALARFATFVWLEEVEPADEGPDYRAWRGFHPRSAWISAGRAPGRRALLGPAAGA